VPSLQLRYAAVLLGSAFAALILKSLAADRYAVPLFYILILLCAWSLGTGPAILSAALCAALRDYVFPPKTGLPGSLLRFCLVGFFIVLFSHINRKALQRAEEQAHLAQERLEEVNRAVSEHQRAEALLRQSEMNLSRTQRITHLGSWETDLTAGKVWWSEETYRIFGLLPGAPVTRELFFRLVRHDDREKVRTTSEKAQIDGKPYWIEHWIVRPDGSERTVREQAEVIMDPSGKAVRMIGSIQDITEHRQLEEQLRQAQKMEAVGRLAGGISHDFNNLLTIMTGYAYMLQEHWQGNPATGDMVAEIAEIIAAVDRATRLTAQLLVFSRKQVLQPKVLNVNASVSEVQSMLRRLISENIRLSIVLAPTLLPVIIDPGQLEQVILNLAINARDAMPHGGTLTIETANVTLDAASAEPYEALPGPYVLLAVRDNGLGMTADVKARVFDPFFTTKEAGRGTGLGLATVYGIVRQSGGYIGVYSEPNEGATFKIYFPCAAEDTEMESPLAVTRRAIPPGSETILVVEDETDVRELIRRILEQQGYCVKATGDARDAVQICSEPRHAIQLLLTDVIMPEMSGAQVFAAARPLRPELKVLYISGYTDSALSQHGVLESGVALISKPFTPASLVAKVREVLDAT
jgi:two-component system, cell cycle sensor histidine kinase and response regulator CckA